MRRDSRERLGRDNHDQQYNPRQSSSSRFDEKPPPSRMKNPPSRHLWVGNLWEEVAKSTLVEHFLRYGELESVACPPGRGYAFVNFVNEDDAVAALRSLQGYVVAGMPLKIEFSKSDKSSASRDDSYYQHRGELQPSSRRSAISPRESLIRDAIPEYLPEPSRRSDNIEEEHPSEILWIGFPAFLKVDETMLRKAFSPFGDIDRITVFSGRTYAFVQFLNIASACRAKETLQGKLFGNPRVHICFARNDHASSGSGRRGVGQINPSSPQTKPHCRPGSSDSFRSDKEFGNMSENPSMRPPHLSNTKYTDSDVRRFGRNEATWTRTDNAYEERGFIEQPYEERIFTELGPVVGGSQGRSPGREGNAFFHEFSPRNPSRRSSYFEDSLDLPEDPYVFHEAKRLKTGSFLHDREPPESPLQYVEQGKDNLSRMDPDLPLFDEYGPTHPYRRQPEHPVSHTAPLTDRLNNFKPSCDTFPSPSFSSNSVDWKPKVFELPRSGVKEVWKWEGFIAKSGTPVCRARCFPVGKVMDIILPEFLDCTARTGLDMLAKHYYQATNSWVVFFVAASDADMGYYNEFMHYLGDRKRVAVAKLDERNTLFLVPPSDFSANVLKVPGKVSISGVVLSLEPASPRVASLPPATETIERSRMYTHGGAPFHQLEPPLDLHPSDSFSNQGRTTISSPTLGNVTGRAPSTAPAYDHGSGSVSDLAGYGHKSQPIHHSSATGSTWVPHTTNSSAPSSRGSTSLSFPVSGEHCRSASLEPNRGNFNSGINGMSFYNNSSLHEQNRPTYVLSPVGGLQPEQQARFGSLLPVSHRQSENSTFQSHADGSGPPGNVAYQPENQSRDPPRHVAQTNQFPSEISAFVQSQLQQPLQSEDSETHSLAGGAGNTQDDSEDDPQKRLQATLQLAAALLQQIQQGTRT